MRLRGDRCTFDETSEARIAADPRFVMQPASERMLMLSANDGLEIMGIPVATAGPRNLLESFRFSSLSGWLAGALDLPSARTEVEASRSAVVPTEQGK